LTFEKKAGTAGWTGARKIQLDFVMKRESRATKDFQGDLVIGGGWFRRKKQKKKNPPTQMVMYEPKILAVRGGCRPRLESGLPESLT